MSSSIPSGRNLRATGKRNSAGELIVEVSDPASGEILERITHPKGMVDKFGEDFLVNDAERSHRGDIEREEERERRKAEAAIRAADRSSS